MAGGGDPNECAVDARRVGDECRRACEKPFPPDCRSRCDQAIAGLKRSCEAQGLSDEECQKRIDAFLAGCSGGCREPPLRLTCEERCDRAAAKVKDSCLAAGGTAEECDAKAADFLAMCQEHCEKPEPPTCDERCQRAADEAFSECVADGGAEEDCRAKANALHDACVVRCNEEHPLPCDERCAQVARQILANCQEAGGENCEEKANAFLERCMGVCGKEPPAPPPCGERCAAAAEKIAAACAARGGSADECAAVVAAFTARCRKHCDDGAGGGGVVALQIQTPSESLCSERSAELMASCVALGRSAGECDLLTMSFEEKCSVVLGGVEDWFELAALAPPRPFVRGDSNRDGRVDIADPVNTLNGIFIGKGNAFQIDCRDRLDANDDGKVDISDPVFTLLWLFNGGSAPPAPGPKTAGQDPTSDLGICFE
jgi:hypothetical protein